MGKALRRIVWKSVGKVTKSDMQQASGLLQTCSGLESGIEAVIHVLARTWEPDEDDCETDLFIDAENAFNSLNQATALHNVVRRCPTLNKYLQNSYRQLSKLGNGSFIISREGCTQEDKQATSMYAVYKAK